MTLLHQTLDTSVPGEHDAPDPQRLISGNPQFTTWLHEDRDGLYCGIWQATPGKWRVAYDEWEYFRITQGHSILTPDGTDPIHLLPGTAHIIRPGLSGTWEVIETTIKDFVIRT